MKRYIVIGLVVAVGSVIGGSVIGVGGAGASGDDIRPGHPAVQDARLDDSPKVTWW